MAVRESPSKLHHKFVEFFDVRDAARVLNELNGQVIGGGVRLLVEFSRPCGSGHSRSYQYHHESKKPGQQNFLLPPRLARSNSQASSSNNSGRGRGNQEGVVISKRNYARIMLELAMFPEIEMLIIAVALGGKTKEGAGVTVTVTVVVVVHHHHHQEVTHHQSNCSSNNSNKGAAAKRIGGILEKNDWKKENYRFPKDHTNLQHKCKYWNSIIKRPPLLGCCRCARTA